MLDCISNLDPGWQWVLEILGLIRHLSTLCLLMSACPISSYLMQRELLICAFSESKVYVSKANSSGPIQCPADQITTAIADERAHKHGV